MIFLLDKNMRILGVLSNENPKAVGFSDDKHKENLDTGYETYEFSAPVENPLISGGGYRYFGLRDNERVFHVFKILREENIRKNGRAYKQFSGESLAAEIARTIVRPMSATTMTAAQALTAALQGSVWQVGIVDWAGTASIEFKDYPTALAAVRQIRDKFKNESAGFFADLRFRCELDGTRVTGRYVDLLERRGEDVGKRFTYEKDLPGLERTYDVSDVVTALVPVGKDGATIKNASWSAAGGDPVDKPQGQDWVGDPDALQAWSADGQHIFGLYRNDQESDPAVLLQAAWDQLQTVKNGRITYETDVTLLGRLTGREHEQVHLGDTVLVKDLSFNPPLLVTARIIELERSYADPARDKAVLGNYVPVITTELDEIRRIQTVLSLKDEIAKGTTPPASPVVDTLWLDTNYVPNILRRWNGSEWVAASPTTAAHIGAETPDGAQAKADTAESNAKSYSEKKMAKGSVPPDTPAVNDLWLDTAVIPNVMKRWTGSEWVKATPTTADEVGAETPTGAQSKADAAQAAANAYADNLVNLVNNTTKSGTLDRWFQPIGWTVENVDFQGKIVPVQKASTTGNLETHSDYFQVDPSKAYQVSAWLKSDSAVGMDYLGIVARDASHTIVAMDIINIATLAVTTPSVNHYFWYGDVTPLGEWKQLIGYIMPTGTPTNMFQGLGQNVTSAMRFLPNVSEIAIRILNFYNNGTAQNLLIANPTVVEMAGAVPASTLSGAINVATNNIKQDSNFFWDASGLYAKDPANANRHVRLTSGGLGVTKDGGATYKNAITADGVVAESITAGTITGVKIVGGQITSNSTINVTTDLYVGNTIQLGDFLSQTDKFLIFNDTAKISSAAGSNAISISGQTMTLFGGNIYLGTAPSTFDAYCYHQFHAPRQSALSVTPTATQALAAGVDTKVTVWGDNTGVQGANPYGEWNKSTQKFTVAKDGIYIATASLRLTGLTPGDSIMLTAYRNGLYYTHMCRMDAGAGPYGIAHATGSAVMFLAAGDVIELYAYSFNGATVNTGATWSFWKMFKMG